MWFCFISHSVHFFLDFPKRMEVKCDNMLHRVEYVVTCEAHIAI